MAARFTLPAVPRITGQDMTDERIKEALQEWMTSTREVLQEAITSITSEAQRRYQPAQLPSATVDQLEGADPRYRAGGGARVVFCTDEAGGATLAFSDGTNWRRATDLAIVTPYVSPWSSEFSSEFGNVV